MQVRCEYCRQMVDESLKTCPHCGADISGVNRMADETPKTIEELKQWYQEHHLPPEEVTRFFIGKDIREPKAFGIYRSTDGDFVVYKNKADGTRAVRYQGVDEAYAVNELYQRLRAEISDQKQASHARREDQAVRDASFSGDTQGNRSVSHSEKKKDWLRFFTQPIWLATYVILIASFFLLILDHSPSRGYYRYNGDSYYYQGSNWFIYDTETDDWYRAENADELNEVITDDTAGEYASYFDGNTGFEDTTWYDGGDNSDDADWDNDNSWDDDNDDWDFGGTDWDSDW